MLFHYLNFGTYNASKDKKKSEGKQVKNGIMKSLSNTGDISSIVTHFKFGCPTDRSYTTWSARFSYHLVIGMRNWCRAINAHFICRNPSATTGSIGTTNH